jgi:hypothetical protein
VYSLLDDLAETAAWRSVAARTAVAMQPLKGLLGRRRKAKTVKEDLEVTAESGD